MPSPRRVDHESLIATPQHGQGLAEILEEATAAEQTGGCDAGQPRERFPADLAELPGVFRSCGTRRRSSPETDRTVSFCS
jgi:hypothetical protein